ncbi:hydrogenase nickel incorporation protein HypB [bacterium]|nr:hydrogenase nickel incorporation protein HypB [bacterium]
MHKTHGNFGIDLSNEESLLAHNKELAKEIHENLKKRGIRSFDFMGSVGAGKTTTLEKLSEALKVSYRISVLAGDLTTTIDADRIAAHGVRTFQINTGKECHLDAHIVAHAIEDIPEDTNLLFIENVGNLVCPGDFPLGTDMRVVVVSVTEGPYMVKKHPYIFAEAQVAVINKSDMARAMDVSVEALTEDIHGINPEAKVVVTSARTAEGIPELISALGL